MSQWSCSSCTFINDDSEQQCSICLTERSNDPQPSTEDDYEFAKMLQEQFLKEDAALNSNSNNDSNSNTNSSNNSNTNSNSNTNINTNSTTDTNSGRLFDDSPSNSPSVLPSPFHSMSIHTINRKKKRANRKRKRCEMEEYDPDDDDIQNNNNNNNESSFESERNIGTQLQIREIQVKSNSADIIYRVGISWIPRAYSKSYVNPVITDQINFSTNGFNAQRYTNWEGGITSRSIEDVLFGNPDNTSRKGVDIQSLSSEFPYFILDFNDLKISLTSIRIRHPFWSNYNHQTGRHITYGNDHYLTGWILEGSNNLIWNEIYNYSNSLNAESNVHVKLDSDIVPFYRKFRLKMTRNNSSNNKILRIRKLELFGNVRRKVYKLPRIGEVKEIKRIKFPQITANKCGGDPNKVFSILNDWDGLEHNEYKEYVEDIPNLQIELKDYQKRGLSWLLDMEDNGNSKFDGIYGGLLCDEMGLGKTVQIIALMLVQRQKKLMTNKEAKDRTIIITPLSLIDQWIGELTKIAGKNTFKYVNYYGTQRKRLTKSDFIECDVVFSTTQTFSNSMGKTKRIYDHFEQEWYTECRDQQLIFKLPAGFFDRIIVDESHEIKKTASNRSTNICSFATKCHSKWCLTGTPIKNDLPLDLAGMCRFLGLSHDKYCKSLKLTSEERKKEFTFPADWRASRKSMYLTNKWLDLDNTKSINKIKDFLKPLMMRRVKKKVLNNDFVEKEEIILKCKLNDEERIIYDKTADEAYKQYKQFKDENTVIRHYMFLLRMITKLRQLCDHSSLVYNRSAFNNNNNNNNNENENNSNSNTNVMDYASNIDILSRVQDAIIHRLNEMESIINYECPICFELTQLNGVILAKCGHLFCNECVNDLEDKICALCRASFTPTNILKITHVLKSEKIDNKHKDELEEFEASDNNDNDGNNNNNNDKYANYNEYISKYSNILCMSSKINTLIDRLKYIQNNHSNDKVLVFSNFINCFRIISNKLEIENIKYLKYIGSLNRKKRKKILDEFKNKSLNINVLLISSKCASVGLNLMCANHVIFVDPRWNPGLDNQAIGRCWRIGQTKKVYVTRLIIENTIEERILSLQQTKNENEEENLVNLKQTSKLTESDYDILFEQQQNE